MRKFLIESKAGVTFGVYEGETALDAWHAMVADGGSGAEGTIEDWILREVRFFVEGMGLRGWSRDYVEMRCDAAFATEAEAEAAISELVRAGCWARADLRVRAL